MVEKNCGSIRENIGGVDSPAPKADDGGWAMADAHEERALLGLYF